MTGHHLMLGLAWYEAARCFFTGEEVPPENPVRPFEVPQTLNVKHGVFVVECLDTAELAADGVREFALILTHPKLRGASGAWTAPIALV